MELRRMPGLLGGVGLPKHRTKPTTIVVEELWSRADRTERLGLARKQLEPERAVLISIRELPQGSE
jgi:hypothetical protein